jgi:pyruvate ferredoxin oxidoreductase beta subunit
MSHHTGVAEALKNAPKFSPKNLPTFEALVHGHRACQGCGEVLALRQALKAIGGEMIVASATGCMEIITSPYPHTAWAVPWIHVAFECAAAVASGIEAGRKAMQRKGKLPADEKVTIIAMAGDGGTADIGLQALSGAMERGHNYIYICLDNEAYMNTGIQRSSSTPWGATTTTSPAGELSYGQKTEKKDLPAIMAAHGVPYVATASPAFYTDLMAKAKKASLVPGPAYLHIYSPCPTGWRSSPDSAISLARLAVETKVFPLYEVIEGKYTLNKAITKPKPVEEYLKPQRRFSHLGPEQIAHIQAEVNAKYDRLVYLAGQCAPAKEEQD